jgi:mono/diheme cytochrome c family protein
MRQCIIFLCMLAGFFSLANSVPPPIHAQADSSSQGETPAKPQTAARESPGHPLSKKAAAATGELYQRHCAKCHGQDGTGAPGRHSLPDIPNFTAGSWHAHRTDAQLLTSILEGKGDDMPAFARKIKEQQARDLVSQVRSFAPTKEKPKQEKKQERGSSDFEERFSRLQKEMEELRRQSRELSEMIETRPVAQLFQQQCAKCHPRCDFPTSIADHSPQQP